MGRRWLFILIILLILISGCAEKAEEVSEEKPEKGDIELMPESVLKGICEKESWPSDCSMIPDPKGRKMCKKCKELPGYEKKEGIERIPESELWELCRDLSPEACSAMTDPEGIELCEKCMGLTEPGTQKEVGGPEEGLSGLDSQFSFVEGDSESWMVLESIIGAYVPSPAWFRFDYLSEGPSLRCRQFANLEKAKNNVEPLGEAVVDYMGIISEPYLFEFGEQGTTSVNIVASILNSPPNDYILYKCESKEIQEEGYPIPKEDLGAEAILGPDDMTQITSFKGEGLVADPDFSPDGSQIIFSRLTKEGEDKNGRLYIVNSDGTGLTKIGHEYLYDASWSPVDNRILCYGGKYSDLYIIDLDKDKTKAVPFNMKNSHLAIWSPDATKIAYVVYDDTNTPIPRSDPSCDGTGVLGSIWIMNSDGTGKTQLTTEEDGYCSGPSFSPDGSKIVYNKGFIHGSTPYLVHRTAHEIWVMNSDGSNKHAIYKPEASIHYLYQNAWSKNNEIMFPRMWWKRKPQIWSINSDGTNPQCLLKVGEVSKPEDAAHEFMYGDVAWDKTGTKIVATKEINPGPGIYEDCNIVIFSLEE